MAKICLMSEVRYIGRVKIINSRHQGQRGEKKKGRKEKKKAGLKGRDLWREGASKGRRQEGPGLKDTFLGDVTVQLRWCAAVGKNMGPGVRSGFKSQPHLILT